MQKSSLFYQQILGMIQTHVTLFLKFPCPFDDKTRVTVQQVSKELVASGEQVPQFCSLLDRLQSTKDYRVYFFKISVVKRRVKSPMQCGFFFCCWCWTGFTCFTYILPYLIAEQQNECITRPIISEEKSSRCDWRRHENVSSCS